jgi:hypothetical protein
VKETLDQATPASVDNEPKQAGENAQRKVTLSMGSSLVWTKRMLDTLERGIKGGCWFSLMDKLDRWLRMRLRSILRKRVGRKGRGHGKDHQRYPNAYFAELGLISLKAFAQAQRTNPA